MSLRILPRRPEPTPPPTRAPRTRAHQAQATGRGVPLGRRVAALGLLLAGCGTQAAVAGAPGGLVILPSEQAPLHPDVLERPSIHEFGSVPDGDVVEHTFRLKNTSDEPITVTRLNPSCGCTVPSLSYVDDQGQRVEAQDMRAGAPMLLAIPPGKIAELTLRIDTSASRTKNVEKALSTAITTDSDVTPFLLVETHILIENPFIMTPRSIELGPVARNGGATGKVTIVNMPGMAHRIVGLREGPDWLEANFYTDQQQGREVWVLEVTYPPPLEIGRHSARLELDVLAPDGSEYRPLVVNVNGLAVEDVQTNPARFVGVVQSDATEPVTLEMELYSLLPGHHLFVSGYELEPDIPETLRFSAEALKPDSRGYAARWKLKLEARGPLSTAQLRGTLTLFLSDPQTPVKQVPFVLHGR